MDPLELLGNLFSQLINLLFSEAFFKAIIFPGVAFVLLLAMMSVWYERKFQARIMLRIGPLHVGRVAGILQVIADFLKLLGKEFIIPKRAIRSLFVSAPLILVFLGLLMFAFIPFGGGWVIYSSSISLLLIFVLIAVKPLIALLAGWASQNSYSLIGTVRLAFQLFAYEIPMFLSMMGVVMLARSFDLTQIVESQVPLPYFIPQLVGMIVFIVCLVAETERVPFDIPTAEQEIVFGWRTEYSSIFFGLIFLDEFVKLDALVFLLTELYFGGWLGPSIPGIPTSIAAPFWLLLKASILLTTIMLLRGIFPRINLRQMLDLGWKVLIPLAMINLLITATLISLPLGLR